MNYTGKFIVTNEEGIREEYAWGTVNKLLCYETTGDKNFTFGEITYTPNTSYDPISCHEAFHILQGRGIFKAWPQNVSEEEPIIVKLRPGTEVYVRGDVPHTVENTGQEPLFGVFLRCHMDRPCHAHGTFSHLPGEGNHLHSHPRFVEAMYLVEGPGSISTADPFNDTVKDYVIEVGSAVYHPLNTIHRQFHPGSTGKPNFWVHAGFYYADDRPMAGVMEIPEIAFWQKEK